MTVSQLAGIVSNLASSVDKLSRKVDGLVSGRTPSSRKAEKGLAFAKSQAVATNTLTAVQPKAVKAGRQHYPAEPLPNGTTTVPANWKACFDSVVAEVTAKGCGTVNYTFAQHPTEPKAGEYWLYLSFASKAEAGKVKDFLKANYGFRFSLKHSDNKGGTSTWVCSGKMNSSFIPAA